MPARLLMLAVTCLIATHGAAAEPIVDAWRYTLSRPADGWFNAGYNDQAWTDGMGGFGVAETPGARVATNWQTDDIWLRKRFKLQQVPQKPALLVHHDEDARIFLNGKQVASLDGYTTKYELVPLAGDAAAALVAGENLLAVHCHQTGGGQFIDVHVVDADNVPKLPEPQRSTKPFASELITDWGARVTAENAWRDYPRPQMVRDAWTCLNGHWDYAITSRDDRETPGEWGGKILVPFPLESRLSGVQRLLDRTEALWYRRQFEVEPRPGRRTLLNFEAVDYRCDVYVNGQHVGQHQGGHTPFTFDITDSVRRGDNELVVRVEDATEDWQLRGKQVLNPRGIWYTQMSGIWQTVWLEEVPATHIADLIIRTDAEDGTIEVEPKITGDASGHTLKVIVKDEGVAVAETNGDLAGPTIDLDNARLWSPRSPHLYELEIELLDAQGNAVDKVHSYAGVRTLGKARDADGHLRFTLNGQPIFHWGTLDQGWWPDGLLTPPSDEAMLSDVEFLKAAGFNMIRKHIKVEPRRYYYHCDRLGMMVWQDQVSGGQNPVWSRFKTDPKDAPWPSEHHAQYMLELERMIDTLENHPCIVVWVPFNEAWGQHRTIEVGQWLAQRDPSRAVNVASGGNFWPVGDVADFHSYPHPSFPFDAERFGDFIQVVGEFGGHGLPLEGHLWDPNRRNWGYGNLPKGREEYQARYRESLERLNALRAQGIAAGVYTQTTDVEGEVNGLLTYDRKVVKFPPEELAKLHEVLFEEDEK